MNVGKKIWADPRETRLMKTVGARVPDPIENFRYQRAKQVILWMKPED